MVDNTLERFVEEVKTDGVIKYGLARNTSRLVIIQPGEKELEYSGHYSLDKIFEDHTYAHNIIDMEGVETLSSTVIGLMAALYFQLQAQGNTLTLCGVSGEVSKILDVAGFDKFMDVTPHSLESVFIGLVTKIPRRIELEENSLVYTPTQLELFLEEVAAEWGLTFAYAMENCYQWLARETTAPKEQGYIRYEKRKNGAEKATITRNGEGMTLDFSFRKAVTRYLVGNEESGLTVDYKGRTGDRLMDQGMAIGCARRYIQSSPDFSPLLNREINCAAFEGYPARIFETEFPHHNIRTNRDLIIYLKDNLAKPSRFWEKQGNISLPFVKAGPTCGKALYNHFKHLGIISFGEHKDL